MSALVAADLAGCGSAAPAWPRGNVVLADHGLLLATNLVHPLSVSRLFNDL